MRSTAKLFVLAVSLISAVFIPSARSQTGNPEVLLHSFRDNGKDGYYLYAGLVFDHAGNLYGTTNGGTGLGSCDGVGIQGCGTVFELARNANGTWVEKVLYSFQSDNVDGWSPLAGLIMDDAGNLYGTTQFGGTGNNENCLSVSCGTVFELVPAASGKWTERVLYNFNNYDGAEPSAGLILDGAGNLYGTTRYGGAYAFGVVFELTPNADGQWTETVLQEFNGTDGCTPGGLIFDKDGNLYGTTSGNCGAYSGGTVFQLERGQDGKWGENVLYNFQRNGQDGYTPVGIAFDSTGNLYGTTLYGGTTQCTNGCGTVFELAHGQSDQWTESVLYSLGLEDGGYPTAGVIICKDGSLYGTTSAYGPSGPAGAGAVFRLSQGMDGQWMEEILHTFASNDQQTDGFIPFSGVIFDRLGNLYGTTNEGGAYGWGTVYKIARGMDSITNLP